ncbi:MAG: hypothetical protein ACJ77A_03060 [Actinomycetota bacterium]
MRTRAAADLAPRVVFSALLEGSDNETGWSVAAGADGSEYVVGNTWSSDFPTTERAYDRTLDGQEDVFFARIDPTGSHLMYLTLLGGRYSDNAIAVAVGSPSSASDGRPRGPVSASRSSASSGHSNALAGEMATTCTVSGSSRPDTLIGTPRRDVICGGRATMSSPERDGATSSSAVPGTIR